jgi:glycosyltransferase involved in cell wall biosynthesis
MPPKVSINLCCYNSERYLQETIECIVNQTFKDWELVIVNDGSSDSTESIIHEYINQGYIIIYHYQENHGLSYSRNKALELSSGELIAFIDHDDIWLPSKLEKQMLLFEMNPEAMLVYSDCHIVDINGKYVQQWKRYNKLYRGMVFNELLSKNFIPISAVVLRKNVFSQIGNFLPYKNAEEYDLYLKCAQKYFVDYVDEVLVKYRIHDSNYSHTHSDIAFKEAIEIYNYWSQEKSIVSNVIKKTIKKSISKRYYYYGKSLIFQKNNPSEARKYFSKGLKYNYYWKTVVLYMCSFIRNPFLLKLSKIVDKTIGELPQM